MTTAEERLRAFRDVETPPAASVSALRWRIARRRRRWAAAAAVGVVLLVAGGAVAWPDGSEQSRVDTVDNRVSTSTQPESTSTSVQPSLTTSSTMASRYQPSTSTIVTAGPDGVTLFNGDDVAQLSMSPAAAAYAVTHEMVVFQDASAQFDVFPPTPENPARVWFRGEVRDLPVDPEATAVKLLDATVVGAGAPMALVAETFGMGASPEDRFEELVRIDLRDLSRRVVVRRPSWESAHVAGRLLPDGDVVGLFSSEAQLLMARWSTTRSDALWTAEIGVDVMKDLTLRDGEIVLVDVTFEGSDLEPTVSTERFGVADGSEGPSEVFAIRGPGGELGAGLFCTGWLSATEIACGRSDGPPVAVSVETEQLVTLPGEAAAIPTVIGAS